MVTLLTVSTVLASCSDSDDETPITLSFAPVVGAEDFVCGQAFSGLGTNADTLTVNEFRLYVHDVRLVDASGGETAVALDDDGMFQNADVAYLDFADSSISGCEGDAATRSVITGTVPAGNYVGVRFRVGVPFDQNHSDPTTAPAPVNNGVMAWNWQGGRKFMRLDGSTAGLPGWRFHLGSTGCDGDPMAGGVTMCANPNRPEVELSAFDAGSDVITVDVAALVAGDNLSTHTMATPEGCMGGPTDPDCAAYFTALGLSHGGSTPPAQTVFGVQ